LKCDYCGKDEDLPFTCNYCGGTFCAEHRLPEAHACQGDLTRRPAVARQPSSAWGGQGVSGYGRTGSRPIFSGIEVRDILIAWTALALAFVIATRGALGALNPASFPTDFLVSFVAVGSGFVLHELMHKFTAEHYGYWAEFRMWVFGIVLALATSALGFIFAAPGATYIQGSDISSRENGIISVAGPATNIAIACIFLIVLQVGTGILGLIGEVGFYVNLILATFNMLPIMPLDGAKVWRWNKALWAGIFVPLVAVVALYFSGAI
jgi:Zn-dependent protease